MSSWNTSLTAIGHNWTERKPLLNQTQPEVNSVKLSASQKLHRMKVKSRLLCFSWRNFTPYHGACANPHLSPALSFLSNLSSLSTEAIRRLQPTLLLKGWLKVTERNKHMINCCRSHTRDILPFKEMESSNHLHQTINQTLTAHSMRLTQTSSVCVHVCVWGWDESESGAGKTNWTSLSLTQTNTIHKHNTFK